MPVYKDKQRGTFYYNTYITIDGVKKKRMKRGFKTRSEARKAEAELLLDDGIKTSDNPYFKDIIDDFMKWYKRGKKESTIYRANIEINNNILPVFKNKRIKSITKKDVFVFQNELLERLSPKSVLSTRSILSIILNYAKDMEYVSNNVVSKVEPPKLEKARFEYWTLNDFKRFISVVDNDRYKALFMTLFYSGMRIGEVSALKWDDIDFKNNTIDVNKGYYQGTISKPKTESSIRTIKMPDHTMLLIKSIYSKYNDFVFGQYTKPLTANTIVKRYNRYINKSGVKRIRLHDIRHSHASYLINNGYDIQIVSKRLGHAKVSMTLDTYAHLYPNKENEAIEFMNKDF